MGALGVTKLFVVGGNKVRAEVEVGGNELAVLGRNPLLVGVGGVVEGTDLVGEKAFAALKLKSVPPSINVTQMKTRK